MVHFLILIVLFTTAVAHYQDDNSYRPRSEISRTSGVMCPRGQSIDQLFADDTSICKPAPDGKDLICKDYVKDIELPFRCPGKGYVSQSSTVKGPIIRVRCCTKPGLFYLEKDCETHINFELADGKTYTVYDNRYLTGFYSPDGGKTFFNEECRYQGECIY